MSKNVVITIGTVLGLILAVSNGFAALTQKAKPKAEHIEVIGDSKKEVIDTDKPVKISIIGSNNEVEVADGVDVQEVVLSGYANVIVLPSDAKPEITKTGAKNKVKYREEKKDAQEKAREKAEKKAAKIQKKVEKETAKTQEQPKKPKAVRMVNLEGLGQTETIETDEAVVVVLAGMSNKVEVLEAAEVRNITLQGASNAVIVADGIDVQRVTLQGFRNVVVLPHDSKPEVIKEGISNRVKYRTK